MVSAQVAGTYLFYAKSPEGQRIPLLSGRNAVLGPGGSSEGVIANTPEKWANVSVRGPVMTDGWELIAVLNPDGAKTIDASDCNWAIPVIRQGFGPTHLGQADFAELALADAAYVAGKEQDAAIYKVSGETMQFGGGIIFQSYEDNA